MLPEARDINGAVDANFPPPSVSLLSNLILVWTNKVAICTEKRKDMAL